MEYSRKVRFHKEISNPEAILEIFDDGTSIRDMYLICINKKTRNLMDIIESTEFTKKIFDLQDYIIIGIAKSKKNAFSLAKDILEDYYLSNKSLSGFRTQYVFKRKR